MTRTLRWVHGKRLSGTKEKLQASSDRIWKDFTEDFGSELDVEEWQEFMDWRSGKRYKTISKKSQSFLEMAYWGIKSKIKLFYSRIKN